METNPKPTPEPIKKPVQKEEKKKSVIIFYIIIGVLICVIGVLTWLLLNAKQEIIYITDQKTTVTNEKVALDEELKMMLVQYDSLEATNNEYKAEIDSNRIKIVELLKEAEKHKGDAAIINKLKKEAATLRTIMKGYIHTIDSLNTLNINLRQENSTVKGQLSDQKEKFKELDKVRESLAGQVKIGQRLTGKNVSVIAQRVKSNNNHRETNRAKSTDKIKICFTIEKNELAVAGTREVYVRIISPSASILPCEAGHCTIEYGSSNTEYSLMREFEYKNEDLEKCIYYDVQNELAEGNYIVEIFAEGTELGRLTLSLK